jgi:DNA-binding LacI/PurR family transcriptional regulator
VSSATRDKIVHAIQELGFRPNQHARSLPTNHRTTAVGILVPFFTDHSFVERLRGAQRALNDSGPDFELLLYNVESPQHYREQMVRLAKQRMVQGLLNMNLPVSVEAAQLLRRLDIPTVQIGMDHQDTVEYALPIDNQLGGRLATQYLIELGHQRIAYIGDSYPDEFGFLTSKNRHLGYQQALLQADLDLNPDYTRLGRHGRDVARLNCLKVLSLSTPPTAIFAMSDIQALGCIAAVREMSLRIPEDVSIVGFDDIEISTYANLTTVSQQLEMSGYLGMQYLIRLMQSSRAEMADVPNPHLPDLTVVRRQTAASVFL